MLDKQFDNIINKKLKDHLMEVPDSDWNVFSQKLKVALENTDPSDQLFDEAIKSKLAAADIDTPAPNWSTFSAMLHADIADSGSDITDQDFDAIIKEKLVNPEIEIPQADWPAFASILATSAEASDISDSAFDNVIQNKLENNAMDIPSPNWNAFSQKLQEASDQELDTEVKSKLENYSTRYNESHWSILRNKMIESKQLRRNLYGLKWFDAALSILLFMTFFNFVADRFIPDADKGYADNTEATISGEIDSANAKVEATNSSDLSINNTIKKNENVDAPTLVSSQDAASKTVINNSIGSDNVIINANNSTVREYNPSNGFNSNTVAIENRDTISLASMPRSDAQESYSITTLLDSKVDIFNHINLSSITGITPSLIGSKRDLEDIKLDLSPLADKTLLEVSNKNGWALHAVIGNNNHLISTPLDTFVYELPYETRSKNLNFDVRISKEINDVELMTGIAYQQMSYASRVTEPIEKDGEEYNFNISKIQFNLIKLPIAVRWNYGINDKLSFFADLGISANILASSDYTISETLIPEESSETKPQPTEFSPDGVNPGWDRSSLARKNYQKGIFQEGGATLMESIYGTLDTGLGINYKLNKQIETYARGTINQALGQFEMGPNYDSYTTFGLQLGLKYNLGN